MTGLGGLLKSSVDFLSQDAEVDRFRKQSDGPTLERLAFGVLITIGRDHEDRHFWPRCLDLREHLQAAHAWHVDVREDQDQRWIGNRLYPLQRIQGRVRELHFKA